MMTLAPPITQSKLRRPVGHTWTPKRLNCISSLAGDFWEARLQADSSWEWSEAIWCLTVVEDTLKASILEQSEDQGARCWFPYNQVRILTYFVLSKGCLSVCLPVWVRVSCSIDLPALLSHDESPNFRLQAHTTIPCSSESFWFLHGHQAPFIWMWFVIPWRAIC